MELTVDAAGTEAKTACALSGSPDGICPSGIAGLYDPHVIHTRVFCTNEDCMIPFLRNFQEKAHLQRQSEDRAEPAHGGTRAPPGGGLL